MKRIQDTRLQSNSNDANYQKILKRSNGSIIVRNINIVAQECKYYSAKNLIKINTPKSKENVKKNIIRVVSRQSPIMKKFFFDKTIHRDCKLSPVGNLNYKNFEQLRREKYEKEMELLNENEDDDLDKKTINSSPKKKFNRVNIDGGFFSLFH